jgi:hypothetical protein
MTPPTTSKQESSRQWRRSGHEQIRSEIREEKGERERKAWDEKRAERGQKGGRTALTDTKS